MSQKYLDVKIDVFGTKDADLATLVTKEHSSDN